MNAPVSAPAAPLDATNIFDPELIESPWAFYAKARAEAPVWRDPSTGIVQVFSYKLICEVARDKRGLLEQVRRGAAL